MTKRKVLIAYGTRYGSTEEISKDIADILSQKDVEFKLIDLKKVKEKNWPPIEDFNGIIVGSSIKIGRWMKEPTKFLKKNKEKINRIKKPLGLFVSSGTAITNPEKAKSDYLEKVINEIGIKTDIFDTFGAIYDFSESSRLGRFSRAVLLSGAKDMTEQYGIEIKENEKNVLIDREKLNQFVNDFIDLLNG